MKTFGKALLIGSIGSNLGHLSLTKDEVRVKIPHCSSHADGAKLQVSVDKKGLDLVFRSLVYQRKYCTLNGLNSSKFAHFTQTQGFLGRFIPK